MANCVYFEGKTCDGSPSDAHCATCLLALLVGSKSTRKYGREIKLVPTKGPQ